MKCWAAVFLLFLNATIGLSQTVQADFSLPVQACLNQNFEPVNLSTNASRYEWDFCQGDLALATSASLVVGLGGNITTGVEVVFDGTNWYGFIANQNGNSILKLSFGTSVTSTPTITNLGNISGMINSPTDIKVINDNGNWYGFVYGLNSPMISRVDFGSSLNNNPTASAVLSGSGSTNGGFDMIQEGANWMIVLNYFNAAKIVRLTSITATPGVSDVLDVAAFGSALGDVALLKSNGSYFAYAIDFGNHNLYRLAFGASVFNAPIVTNLSVGILTGVTPYGIDVGQDNLNYYAMISTLEGSLIRVTLGQNLSSDSPTGASLGNMGMLENTLKVKLLKHQSQWFAFSPSWNSTNLYRINFSEPVCEISPSISTLSEPLIKYASTGTKTITLRAFAATGAYSEMTKSLFITPDQAPNVSITYLDYCITSPTNFSVTSTLPLSSYNWDFGDGFTSTAATPSHQYASVGAYDVELVVTATNGCQNLAQNEVEIFNQPVANFSLPVPATSCTNQDYLFNNTSIADVGSNTTWQWQVDNVNQSTSEDAFLSFSSIGNHDVKLIASIPGCNSEISKTFSIAAAGPNVAFDISGSCQNSTITFTNETTGPVNSFLWDFGNGQTSVSSSPTMVYTNIGIYSVTLTASNSAGCSNTNSEQVTIYSQPQVNFAAALPPFSCNGSPTQFNDLTPGPPDSNITSWQWNFGDPASGQNTSAIKNPQHTYANAGNYDVTLTVSTNFSCSATLQKSVPISQTPTANFNHAPACEDVPVNFTDASSGGTIDTWSWQIGTSMYSVQNPTHTFNNPGSVNATLTVTATNDCISTVSKTILVPTKLTPNFSVSANCTNQQTVFTNTTSDAVDPVTNCSWVFGSLGSATGLTATFTFPSTGNVPVTLTTTSQNGCVNSTSKMITILSSPVAEFVATPNSGGPPLVVQFTNSSQNASSFLWSFDDANNSTSAQVSPTFTFQDVDQYSVQLSAFNSQNCVGTVTHNVDVVLPVMDVGVSGLELIQQQNGALKPAVTVHNYGNVSINNVALLLDLSGSTIREYVTANILPKSSYRYVFQFEFPDASMEYFCVEAEVDDAVPDNNRACLGMDQSFITFSPYPNPAKGSVNVQWILTEDGVINLTLINSMGQEVRSAKVSSIEGLNPFSINTEGLGAGAYILQIAYGRFNRIYKVIISE